MTFPTIGPQFDSDERAQLILKNALQGNFIVRDHKPDIFLDYQIERRICGEPSGEHVFVQLKGQIKLRTDGQYGKAQVDRKALRYYSDNVEDPVFIVLVDITTRLSYYLFVQRWIDEQGSRIGLGGKTRMTIPIPLSNQLANLPKFITEIKNARTFMREKYPGSPEAALAKYVSPYSRLDPRFSVTASIGPTGRNLNISANTPTRVQFNFPAGLNRDAVRQLSEASDYGRPINIPQIVIKAHGSPLFETLLDGTAPVAISRAVKASDDCVLVLSCAEPGFEFSLRLPAHFTMGRRGVSFETLATDSPIAFTDKIEMLGGTPKSKEAVITFHRDTWTGHPVLSIPWYKSVIGFVKATNAQKDVRAILVAKDNELLGATFNPAWTKTQRLDIVAWFDLVIQIRALAEALRINFPFPDLLQLSDETLITIAKAYRVLTTGMVPTTGFSFTLWRADNADLWNEVVSGIRTNGESLVTFGLSIPYTFSFFGQTACLGNVKFDDLQTRVRPAQGANIYSDESIEVEVTPEVGEDIVFTLERGERTK